MSHPVSVTSRALTTIAGVLLLATIPVGARAQKDGERRAAPSIHATKTLASACGVSTATLCR